MRLIRVVFGVIVVLAGGIARGEILPNPAITLSATPFNASFPATNVLDSTQNQYASQGQGLNTFINFDFGATRRIDSFAFANRSTAQVGGDTISSFDLRFSQDAIFNNSDDVVRSFTNPAVAAGEAAGRLYTFAPVDARFVQWDVTGNTGAGFQNLGSTEMRFGNSSQGERVVATAINSATPFNANYVANNAVDGNVGYGVGSLNPEYASASLGASTFVDFDLGAGAMPVSGFDLYQRLQSADHVTSFDLIFANDAAFTNVVATRSYTITGDGDDWTETDVFSPISARFIRFDVTGAPAGQNSGISEIVFFSLPEPTTITIWSLFGLGLCAFAYRSRRKS